MKRKASTAAKLRRMQAWLEREGERAEDAEAVDLADALWAAAAKVQLARELRKERR